jgi:putative Ca2+/H+ antiporter (TMEM165/GDT1 family)
MMQDWTSALEAFLMSTGIVALAEMGDKTQLLSLVLAARFRKPVPIIMGILVATLLNHAMAGFVGAWVNQWLGPVVMRWVLAVSFLVMAGWILIPDTLENDADAKQSGNVFVTTVVAFFLAEMGDKTQIATVALAAQYASLIAVVAGTTAGMMLANAPAVLLGEKVTKIVPMRTVHIAAAALFACLGLAALFNLGSLF